jgi:antitoxin ParD1/3/4
MATMNISLPDKMKKWIEAQIETGRYANVSDYMRDLVRGEQAKAEYNAWLAKEVEIGIASGFHESTIEELFDLANEKAEHANGRKKTA